MKNKKLFFLVLLGGFSFSLVGCDVLPTSNSYLYISHQASKTTFNVGEAFSSKGLTILGMPNAKEISDYVTSPSEGYTFTINDVSSDYQVTVSKNGYKSVSYSISVVNLPALTIVTPGKTNFSYGEVFSFGDLKVVDENNIDVTSELQSNYSIYTELNKEGTFVVELYYAGHFPASYEINVAKEKKLTVTSNPSKTNYTQGEAFNTSGLVVKDENGVVVTDYTLSISNGEILKNSGSNIQVLVEKEGYVSASFTINVRESSTVVDINKTINIYYINDTHGAFIRQDIPDSYFDEGGMAYIGYYIKERKALDEQAGDISIVLSGGDMFQGSLESNITHGDIMIDAMNVIGFDAMVLGNHEFDWGESYIRGYADKLNCPILSTNTFYKVGGARPDYLEPFTIVNRGGVKIGIIGSVQENIGTSISGNISDDFEFPNPVDYVMEYSTLLKETYQCDVILSGFHDGGYEARSGETAPTKFSSLTQGGYVDGIFLAHDHYAKVGKMDDIPFLESACNGEYVGVMSLDIHSDNGFTYTVTDSSVRNINAFTSIYDDEYLPEINNLLIKYQDVIGDPDEVLYYFNNSYSSDDFTVVVCEAMLWYVNYHQDMFDDTKVYMASHNTGGVRANVNRGAFTRRNLFKVFPFDNTLCLQTCTEYNVANQKRSSYYATYSNEEIVYTEGLTHVISISYIAEYKDAYRYYQQSYVEYEQTAKDALVSYLTSGVNPDL